ncbi:MAG: hypothetical protein IID03_05765 [Candidatus Dadabacteria bacterium]|nr:hypothetical protein [Candidatus Dadabacteria bacterium]
MNANEVDLFEKNYAQMQALFDEISNLSKKSPNDAVNKFKLNFINRVLNEANTLLKEKYTPFPDFTGFEEDELPTNSDVTMILLQYINCLEKLRSDNLATYGGTWYWVIDGQRSDNRTGLPKKLRLK